MRRREFLGVIGGDLATLPISVRAHRRSGRGLASDGSGVSLSLKKTLVEADRRSLVTLRIRCVFPGLLR